MEKYLKLISALFIVPLLLLSGCVKTKPEKPVGKGIVITDFYSSRDYVEGKDKRVSIYMEIENQGGYTTDKVLMCLLGSFGDINSGMWKNESILCQNPSRTLTAYDPTTDSPGGTARARWLLKSPWIPYPQESPYEFGGRVYYFYRSMTTTKVKVYSEAEIEAARQRGESLTSVGESTKIISPIDITISTPSLLRAEDGYFTLRITLSNTGGGVVFNPANFKWDSTEPPLLSIDDLNYVNITIYYPSNELTAEGCDYTEDGKCVIQSELKKGETRTISVDFEIKNPGSITTWKEYPIRVEAQYGYYVEKELQITVKGRKGEST